MRRTSDPQLSAVSTVDLIDHTKLSSVTLCYQYMALKMRARAGLPLSGRDTHKLVVLERLLSAGRDPLRRHRRLQTSCYARLCTSEWMQAATLRNISAGGMFVLAKHAIPVGSTIEISVGKPGGQGYTFSGTVRRTSRERGGMVGIALWFGELPVVVEHFRYSDDD